MKKIFTTICSISALGCASGPFPQRNVDTLCTDTTTEANSIRQDVASVCSAKGEPMPERISLVDLESRLEGKRVVAFGENHYAETETFNKPPYHEYPYDDIMFAEAIPILESAGFTHVGVELPDFLQPFIDKYYKDKDPEALEKAISEHYIPLRSIVIVISAAEKHGIQTVCIDHKHKESSNFYVLGSNDEWNNRERRMYENIQKVLSSKTVKLALFLGASHVSYPSVVEIGSGFAWITPPLGRMLHDQYGDNYYSVNLFGCDQTYIDACIESKRDLRAGIK